MAANSTSTTVQPLLVNPEQAAAILGMGLRTLWRHKANREIAFVPVGRKIMFSPDDLRAFVDARRINSVN